MTMPSNIPKAPGQRVDWEAVRRDYRTGRLTNVEIARRHGIAAESMSRRIKNDRKRNPGDWQQDLTKAVREATNAALMSEMVKERVKEGVKTGQDLTVNSVLAAAEVGVQIVLSHRKDARTARGIAAELLDELQGARMLVQERELLAAILAGSGATPADENEARKVVEKALALSGRTRVLKDLADTLAKLQAIERQAFNLDETPAETGYEQMLAQVLAAPRT